MVLYPCQGHPCWTCPSFPSANLLRSWLGRGAAAGPRVAPLPRGPGKSGDRSGAGAASGERGEGRERPGEMEPLLPLSPDRSQPRSGRCAQQLGRSSWRALSSSAFPGARFGAVPWLKGSPGWARACPLAAHPARPARDSPLQGHPFPGIALSSAPSLFRALPAPLQRQRGAGLEGACW